jgi:hypothetical protein
LPLLGQRPALQVARHQLPVLRHRLQVHLLVLQLVQLVQLVQPAGQLQPLLVLQLQRLQLLFGLLVQRLLLLQLVLRSSLLGVLLGLLLVLVFSCAQPAFPAVGRLLGRSPLLPVGSLRNWKWQDTKPAWCQKRRRHKRGNGALCCLRLCL